MSLRSKPLAGDYRGRFDKAPVAAGSTRVVGASHCLADRVAALQSLRVAIVDALTKYLLQRARRAWSARALAYLIASLRSKPLAGGCRGCFDKAPVAAGSTRVVGASPCLTSNNRCAKTEQELGYSPMQ